jgi:proteasome lid subunit RPN8/RPN11
MEMAVDAAAPEEACGLVIGSGRTASEIIPIENIHHSPVRYEMNPKQVLDAFLAIEEANLDLIAIYHSHPHGPSYPSPTDIREAYYPDPAQLIWSGESNAWRCAAYLIQGEGFTEIPIQRVPE